MELRLTVGLKRRQLEFLRGGLRIAMTTIRKMSTNQKVYSAAVRRKLATIRPSEWHARAGRPQFNLPAPVDLQHPGDHGLRLEYRSVAGVQLDICLMFLPELIYPGM